MVHLTHWGRVTYIWVSKITIIGSDNGLSPGGCQAIIWTNAGILLIGQLGTNPGQIVIGIQAFSLKKMHLKVSSVKWRPFCLSLNVLAAWHRIGDMQLPETMITQFIDASPGLSQLSLEMLQYRMRSHVPHDDVIKWKHFPCYWPFVRGIHQSPVNSLIFSLICIWINGWVNNREAGDLRWCPIWHHCNESSWITSTKPSDKRNKHICWKLQLILDFLTNFK